MENLKKANNLILEVTSNKGINTLSDLEKQGLIQRFEFTFELAWKTIQDYLTYLGFEFQTGPNSTLKTAFENSIITDSQTWREMSKARNLSTHTYDEDEADRIVYDIYSRYSNTINNLVLFLTEKSKHSGEDIL